MRYSLIINFLIMNFLIGTICFYLVACSGSDNIQFTNSSDSGNLDTSKDTDAGESPSDTSTSDTDSDNQQKDGIAESECWSEALGKGHPNYNMPDCAQGLVCIGDGDGAWCTESCTDPSAIKTEGTDYIGWCCGEMRDPCNPRYYWMPTSLSWKCIPKNIAPGEVCKNGSSWPSDAQKCMPFCDGTDKKRETYCITANNGEDYFCSFSCNENLENDCPTASNAFAGGCCNTVSSSVFQCLLSKYCE